MKKKNKMLTITIATFLIICSACKNYQVVSELDVHLYHLHNPKNGKVEVIVTKDKLNVGQFYRLKSINKIELE